MSHLAVAPEPQHLDAVEARALTEQIRGATEALWELLTDAYDGRAWIALGYSGFKAYIESEFTITRSYAYELVTQGHVIRTLAVAAGMDVSGKTNTLTHVNLKAAHAVARHLDGVVDRVSGRVASGEAADEVITSEVRAVVEAAPDPHRRRTAERAELRSSAPTRRAIAAVDKVITTALPTQVEILADSLSRVQLDQIDPTTVDTWLGQLRAVRGRLTQLANDIAKGTTE